MFFRRRSCEFSGIGIASFFLITVASKNINKGQTEELHRMSKMNYVNK